MIITFWKRFFSFLAFYWYFHHKIFILSWWLWSLKEKKSILTQQEGWKRENAFPEVIRMTSRKEMRGAFSLSACRIITAYHVYICNEKKIIIRIFRANHMHDFQWFSAGCGTLILLKTIRGCPEPNYVERYRFFIHRNSQNWPAQTHKDRLS